MADKKQNQHYVNNKEFTEAVAEHNEAVKLAESKGKTPPKMSNYIGECIYKIATRLSTRPNFINYTYRDEMICDAIENCIQYIGNFNREKSDNAFAYVTQICYYAFLRRIQKQKKQLFVKQEILKETGISEAAFDTIDGDTSGMVNSNVEWLQDNYNPVNYEPRKSKKARKTDEKGLEKFSK